MNKYLNFMSDLLNRNLNDDDKQVALDSLRLLIKGIPIKDEEGNLIGFIEKPDMNAIKYVLGYTEKTEKQIKNKNLAGKH